MAKKHSFVSTFPGSGTCCYNYQRKCTGSITKEESSCVIFLSNRNHKVCCQKDKKATKGTLSEIKAADRYTDEDLDWSNEKSRVTREHESANTPAASFMEDLHRRP